jgi:hypothetical protein
LRFAAASRDERSGEASTARRALVSASSGIARGVDERRDRRDAM